MSTTLCTYCQNEQKNSPSLSQSIAARIERLRQERLSAYAEQSALPAPKRDSTRLERDVDELLDSLHTLHRLEQLADYAARGGQITVDADRQFIAEYEQTYLQLLEERAPHSLALVSARLLPRRLKALD